jgi:hypothetical protein
MAMQVKYGGAQLTQDLVPLCLRQPSLLEPPDEGGDVLAFLSKLPKKYVGRGRRTVWFSFSCYFHCAPFSRFCARSIPFSNARISRSQ